MEPHWSPLCLDFSTETERQTSAKHLSSILRWRLHLEAAASEAEAAFVVKELLCFVGTVDEKKGILQDMFKVLGMLSMKLFIRVAYVMRDPNKLCCAE